MKSLFFSEAVNTDCSHQGTRMHYTIAADLSLSTVKVTNHETYKIDSPIMQTHVLSACLGLHHLDTTLRSHNITSTHAKSCRTFIGSSCRDSYGTKTTSIVIRLLLHHPDLISVVVPCTIALGALILDCFLVEFRTWPYHSCRYLWTVAEVSVILAGLLHGEPGMRASARFMMGVYAHCSS